MVTQASILNLYFLIAVCAPAILAEDRAIDVQRSGIAIHVGKSGLFSAAGHEHWVNAPISAGVLNDSDKPRVEFRVEAAKLEVKTDPKVDSKTQAEIQKDMQEKTLESAKFPEIAFRSTRVEKQASAWNVEGMLTLHGVTKPITVTAARNGAAYASHAVIKQTDFGIKPITVGGGLVRVKDEVEIDFQILTRP